MNSYFCTICSVVLSLWNHLGLFRLTRDLTPILAMRHKNLDSHIVSILPYSSCDVRETIELLIFWPIMNDNLPVKSMNRSICKL